MTSRLIEQLERWATDRPGEAAVTDDAGGGARRVVTWRQLRNAAGAWAAGLNAMPGGGGAQTVMLLASNRLEFFPVLLGTLLADGRVFPASPGIVPAELARAARIGGATVMVGEGGGGDTPGDGRQRVALEGVALDGDEATAARMARRHRGAGALLLQSSGTTGLPKVVCRGSPALDAVGKNCQAAIGLEARDRMMVVIPICHSYAFDHAVAGAVLAGLRVDLCARFHPREAAEAMGALGTTIFPAVPFMYDVLAQTESVDADALRGLRQAYSAGSVLPRGVFEAFRARFGISIGPVYGATEFGSVTFGDPGAAGFDPMSVGRAMDGVEIRILDKERPRVDRPMPAGTEGHVAVAAGSMLSGYMGQEQEATVDGFVLSGDLGVISGRGQLTLTGRIKLLIDVGGRKVNPMEVEMVLRAHSAVREALVTAEAVSPTVNRLRAVVVWKDGAGNFDELREWARQQLSSYKVPRYFEARAELPRSATGKVMRGEIRMEAFEKLS